MRRLQDFVPAKHSLRAIREMANAALAKLGPLLTAMYAAEAKGGQHRAGEVAARHAAAGALQRAV
jgi:hypothetical protein